MDSRLTVADAQDEGQIARRATHVVHPRDSAPARLPPGADRKCHAALDAVLA